MPLSSSIVIHGRYNCTQAPGVLGDNVTSSVVFDFDRHGIGAASTLELGISTLAKVSGNPNVLLSVVSFNLSGLDQVISKFNSPKNEFRRSDNSSSV